MTSTGLTIPFTGLQKQYNNLRTEILDETDTVLRSGILMNGNYTAEFENWLANKNNSSYAMTCHSGTQALEIIAEYYRDHDLIMVEKPTASIEASAPSMIWTKRFITSSTYTSVTGAVGSLS